MVMSGMMRMTESVAVSFDKLISPPPPTVPVLSSGLVALFATLTVTVMGG
jgi:hypothetical protein